MPILSRNNIPDFYKYLQRKVKEHFPDYETYEGFDRTTVPVATKFKDLACLNSEDGSIQGLSRKVELLIDIILHNGIRVPLKIKGKRINELTLDVIRDIKNENIRLIQRGILTRSAVSTMSGYAESVIDVFRNPLRDDQGPPCLLTQLVIFSSLKMHEKGIVFPSGNLSKK